MEADSQFLKPENIMKNVTQTSPKCYFSASAGMWRVISQGSPICADATGPMRAIQAAQQMNLTPTKLWDGDRGQFLDIALPTKAGCENLQDFQNGLHDFLLIVKRDGQ